VEIGWDVVSGSRHSFFSFSLSFSFILAMFPHVPGRESVFPGGGGGSGDRDRASGWIAMQLLEPRSHLCPPGRASQPHQPFLLVSHSGPDLARTPSRQIQSCGHKAWKWMVPLCLEQGFLFCGSHRLSSGYNAWACDSVQCTSCTTL
jgi:hypothetical protein